MINKRGFRFLLLPGALLLAVMASAAPAPPAAAPAPRKPKLEFKVAGGIYRIAFSPDGKLLAVGMSEGPLDLWDLTTGQLRTHLLTEKRAVPGALAFSPDSRTLVSGMGDGNLLVWDVSTGARKHTLRGEGLAVEAITVLPGDLLLVRGISSIRSWSLKTGKPGAAADLDSSNTTLPVALAASGKVLAAPGLDHTIRVWDGRTGKPLHTLKGHTRLVSALEITPDGQTLVAGDQADQLRAWDLTTGRPRPLNTKVGFIGSVAVSPDGRTAAVGLLSQEGTALWDVGTNRKIATLPRLDANKEIDALAFSRDGKFLAAAEFDVVRVWPVSVPARR